LVSLGSYVGSDCVALDQSLPLSEFIHFEPNKTPKMNELREGSDWTDPIHPYLNAIMCLSLVWSIKNTKENWTHIYFGRLLFLK
jgi:hypothetical protein